MSASIIILIIVVCISVRLCWISLLDIINVTKTKRKILRTIDNKLISLNELEKLINENPNDSDLGKEIRNKYFEIINKIK